jgi:DtxR family transcriptional regulator, Mn-dependent transcriptional regulator
MHHARNLPTERMLYSIAMNYTVFFILTALFLAAPALLVPSWRRWFFARFTRTKSETARTMVEDALKHAFDCRTRNIACTIESLAGFLQTTTAGATRLVTRLEALGLLTPSNSSFRLTEEGTAYALRVIRIHRLWERYLADETSVREADWHRVAEYEEHRMTAADADVLAARLSNPQFDPHGDPIPSATGEMPAIAGEALTAFPAGASCRVVHVEDEPPAMYARLVAIGLHPGLYVVVLENSPVRVRFEAQGEEHVVEPALARLITAVRVSGDQRRSRAFVSLSSLQPGDRAVVSSISQMCRGQQRRRLMDLGIVPGTQIAPELDSLTGDPRAYLVRGTLVALRREQADQIFVTPQRGAA